MATAETGTVTPEVTINAEAVTRDRVAHYREHGWVMLPGLLSRRTAETVRQELDASSKPVVNTILRDDSQPFDFHKMPSEHSELLRRVGRSPQMAEVARRLTGLPAVRFWLDSGLIKKPLSEGGSDTPWHQDFPAQPLDRSGGLQLWIALEDTPAHAGTLQYMSGSHRFGVLGRTQFLPPGTSVIEVHPALAELEVSAAPEVAAGDALVHHCLTMHSAGANHGTGKRWAYTSAWMPADALYTGMPCQFTDGLGLEVNKEFDHPRFPRFSVSGPS